VRAVVVNVRCEDVTKQSPTRRGQTLPREVVDETKDTSLRSGELVHQVRPT
jgi:hypothetical protein